MKVQVLIYSRPGCHLCDEAKQAIQRAGCAGDYELQEVNIENDLVLLDRYRDDIPVVTIDGEELLRHSVDPCAFALLIAAARKR